ncbi:MAG TPA: TetR/AcrR family transcriptional regulator [Streptosporangiaceae bacterium]|jgi:AcrR family transcriptional regulator|nr:TetR/AcrR family transcriptional regulator [Streptosporangiaceae bacterium]
MTTFQRARSEEQREARRQSILDAAAAMLTQMPVADLTLNELSRRVGLAKSNVLRYFETREVVLLELLDAGWQDWLAQVRADLDDAVQVQAPVQERGDEVAAVLAASLAAKPVLCDLLSAQAAVLERNVSPKMAAEYKRAALANIGALSRLLLRRLPELGERDCGRLAGATVLVTGALWPNTQPSPAMIAAYESDPGLAAMRLDFGPTMREVLEVLVSGLLARRSG